LAAFSMASRLSVAGRCPVIGAGKQTYRLPTPSAVAPAAKERGAWALFFVIGIRSSGGCFRGHNKRVNVPSNLT
jgi:hypothetical protein